MPDPAQLPHLMKLIDDESSSIRETVIEELKSFGPSLEEELNASGLYPLNEHQCRILKPVLEEHRRAWLKHEWHSWLDIADEYEKLEKAYSLIADFQLGKTCPQRLASLLDQLAREFGENYPKNNIFQLSKFLFEDKNLRGTETDYYNPRNSNLVYVIKKNKGIPISLASIYMLVGKRLGLKIEGCNFPGHFLARAQAGSKTYWIDCFNGGQFFDEGQLKTLSSTSSLKLNEVLELRVDAVSIIERVLRNLIRAYQQSNDRENSYFVLSLIKSLDGRNSCEQSRKSPTNREKFEHKSLYKPGQLVKHRRYGYRGVVVEFDLSCQADELWYQSNQTQPIRMQPWYHVLVHGARHNTYAAQSNLLSDDSGQRIDHPLLPYFFSEFRDGYYVRNDRPWYEDNASNDSSDEYPRH